ncbi:MAG: CDP-alcohol phosphatidyltransferase family protein [Clostridia bacterium]|nr:CDP-alcohol phosphatidyltransferase family protein [Clostridia bacterium]
MKHIPNILSSIRIAMVGVFAWLFLTARIPHPQNYLWALGIFVLAFVTDVLDGFLARTFNWVTPVGKLLDPLADKLMAITALVVILIGKWEGSLFWIYLTLVILVAVKEILMVVGGMIMLKQRKVAYSDWYGKTATGLFAFGTVLTLLSFVFDVIEPWNIAVLSASIGLSYVALAHYAKTQLFKPREEKPDEDEERLFEKFDRLAK